MDAQRFSHLAHRRHVYANPIAPPKMERVLDLIPLSPGDRVLDIGCGNGALLLRLWQRSAIRGTGVDLSQRGISDGQRLAAAHNPRPPLEFLQADARQVQLENSSFELCLCIGSTHALGGLEATLQRLAQLARPGGCILVGEGYWKHPPHPDYLAALQSTAQESRPHAENVALGVRAGLVPLYSCVSSEDDWDAYEGLYLYNIEQFVHENPDDPDAPAMLERIRRWHDLYLRWGRDTLGFGLYLFRAPGTRPRPAS